MATPRISMRKLRDILRLRFEAKLTIRQIRAATKASIGLIQKLIQRAQELDLGWPLPEALDDQGLQALFYPQADHQQLPYMTVLRKMWFILPIFKF